MKTSLHDLYIFELANNHEGSVDHGIHVIDAVGRIARKHGINASVKLQFRDLDTFIHPHVAGRDDVPHVPRFQRTRLSQEDFGILLEAIRDQGMTPIVTPFDETSVERCLDLGVEILKVASSSAMDWPLLEAVAHARRPTVVSTGGLTIRDIDKIVSFLSHRECDFALMHCVAVYPTPRDQLQLGFIEKMARRYPGVPIGYSGHEEPNNTDAVKIAVTKGARLLERHVGLPVGDHGLNAYSLNPEQAEAWIASALEAQEMLGREGDRWVTEPERDSLRSLGRGVYAARNIDEGTILTPDDVYFAMPVQDGQLSSGDFGRYRATYVASSPYRQNEPIRERSAPDNVSLIRSVVHEAKGLLFEAQIALGKKFEIELSHHMGMEKFRQVGAVIVNVLNREYCKKLVIVLPGQRHPNHRHERKEETFQLLWGDLEITLDGEMIVLEPGDTLLVEKGTWHSFTSRNGAVIEEISTTHYKSDSFYEDEAIASLDPIERKTIVDTW